MSSIVDKNAGTYTFLAKVPGGTQDAYDKTMKELDIVNDRPSGLMLHCAGVEKNGVNVIDLWESTEKWKAFRDGRLMSIGSKYGIVPTPDNFTDATVSNAIILPACASQAMVAYSIRFNDATEIQYIQAMDRLNLGSGLAPGGCAHIASRLDDNTMHIFDLWEDPDSARYFYDSTLPPVLQHVGYKGIPATEMWSVHFIYVSETARVSQ